MTLKNPFIRRETCLT